MQCQRKGASRKQDGKVFSRLDICSSKHLHFLFFKFRAEFFLFTHIKFGIILKLQRIALAKISYNKVVFITFASILVIFFHYGIIIKVETMTILHQLIEMIVNNRNENLRNR